MGARALAPLRAPPEDDDEDKEDDDDKEAEASAAFSRAEETSVVFTRLAGLEEEAVEKDDGLPTCFFTRLRKSTSPVPFTEVVDPASKSVLVVRLIRKRTQLIPFRHVEEF